MAAKAGMRPLLGIVAVAATLAGCSYDWTIDHVAGSIDASGDVMTQPDVDLIDSGVHDSTVGDVGTGDSAPRDTGSPPIEASSPCPSLTQQLLTDRAAAIKCDEMGVMPCMTTVTDECGCQVVVGGAGSAESAFKSAVAAFEGAGCSTTDPVSLCPGTCPTVTHLCLAGDGGTTYTCYQ